MKNLIILSIVLFSFSCNKETPFVRPPDAKGTISLEFKGEKMTFDFFYVNNFMDVDRVQNINISCTNSTQEVAQGNDHIEYLSLYFKQNVETGDFNLYDFQLGRQKGSKRMSYTSIINPENKITVKYIPEMQQQFRLKGTFNGTLDWANGQPATSLDEKVIRLENGVLDLSILRRV